MILEHKDVQFFELKENIKEKNVTISGLAFHSSLGIERTAIKTEGTSVVVEIYLKKASSESSGNFRIVIPLENSTKNILFGKERHLIWESPNN